MLVDDTTLLLYSAKLIVCKFYFSISNIPVTADFRFEEVSVLSDEPVAESRYKALCQQDERCTEKSNKLTNLQSMKVQSVATQSPTWHFTIFPYQFPQTSYLERESSFQKSGTLHVCPPTAFIYNKNIW